MNLFNLLEKILHSNLKYFVSDDVIGQIIHSLKNIGGISNLKDWTLMQEFSKIIDSFFESESDYTTAKSSFLQFDDMLKNLLREYDRLLFTKRIINNVMNIGGSTVELNKTHNYPKLIELCNFIDELGDFILDYYDVEKKSFQGDIIKVFLMKCSYMCREIMKKNNVDIKYDKMFELLQQKGDFIFKKIPII